MVEEGEDGGYKEREGGEKEMTEEIITKVKGSPDGILQKCPRCKDYSLICLREPAMVELVFFCVNCRFFESYLTEELSDPRIKRYSWTLPQRLILIPHWLNRLLTVFGYPHYHSNSDYSLRILIQKIFRRRRDDNY